MSDIKLKIQNVVADEATKQITFDFGVDLSSIDSGDGDWADVRLHEFPLSWKPSKVDSVFVSATWYVEANTDKLVISEGEPLSGTRFQVGAGVEGGSGSARLQVGDQGDQQSVGDLLKIAFQAAAAEGWRHGIWSGFFYGENSWWNDGVITPEVDVVGQFAKIATLTITLKDGESMPSSVFEVVSFFGSGESAVDNEIQFTFGEGFDGEAEDQGSPATSLTVSLTGGEAEESMEPYDPSSGEIDARGKLVNITELAGISDLLIDDATLFYTTSSSDYGTEIEVNPAEFNIEYLDASQLTPVGDHDLTFDEAGVIPSEGIKLVTDDQGEYFDIGSAITGTDPEDGKLGSELIGIDGEPCKMVAFLDASGPHKIVRLHRDGDEPLDSLPPVITIIGDINTEVLHNSGDYTDSGATALSGDVDISHFIEVSGDVVSTSASEGTEYSIIYTVTDAEGLSATATRTVTIVASESTDEDTSEEGDSDSPSEGEDTQPTEENIMSSETIKDKFTFEGDLTGTTTYVLQDTASEDDGSTQEAVASNGEASGLDASCRVKKFLSAVQSKGYKVCGAPLQLVGDDAELYLSDGTAASGLIKNVEFVYGTLTGSGSETTFTPGNPDELKIDEAIKDADNAEFTHAENPDGTEQTTLGDSDSVNPTVLTSGRTGSNKWYLKMTRPGNVIVYEEMDMINDLFDSIDASGKVVSLLGAMQEIEDMQEIVAASLDDLNVARVAHVEALEGSMTESFTSLHAFFGPLESALQTLITTGDDNLKTHINSRVNTLAASLKKLHNDDRLHGEQVFATADVCGSEAEVVFTSGAIEASRASDISKWLIDVAVQEGTKRRNDLEVEFEAQIVDGSGDDAGSKLLQVTTAPVDCDESASGLKLVLNAIFTGDVSVAPDASFEGSDTMADPLPEYSIDKELVLRTGDAANASRDQNSQDAGHQPGYKVGIQDKE